MLVKWVYENSILLVIAEGVKQSEITNYQVFYINNVSQVIVPQGQNIIISEFIDSGKKNPRFDLKCIVTKNSIIKVVKYGTSKIYLIEP